MKGKIVSEHWNDTELALLIKEWGLSSREKIQSLFLDRSWSAIKCKASALSLRKDFPQNRQILDERIYREKESILDSGKTFRFGICSDTHYGSKYAQITHLHDFYKLLEREGITTCFHAGDLSDGNGEHYRGQRYEMHIEGADNLKDFIVSRYPKFKNGKTYMIAGFHDLDLWVKEGYDLLKRVSEDRKDMVYLGQASATYILGDRKIYLLHPAGGTAYALSYNMQKLAESFSANEKPHVALVGHYHRMEFLPALRNIQMFQTGNFQWQTPFAVRKMLAWQYGGWLAEMKVSKNGISSMKATAIPFYKPILDDWKNYE